jgi:adenylate cyclase
MIINAPLISRERPSVAVLPCRVSAAEPEHRYFGECVAEGIAIALCRTRSLAVVVPRSLQASRLLDPKRAAQEVGAKYALIGTVTRTGERVRIIIHLLDATTGFHVWGDTYDGVVGDLLGLQDRVINGVTRAVLPQIRGAEIERAQRKPPSDHDAYDLTMGAFPFVLATYPGAAKRALDLLNQAMERDPDYAPATALAAACHAQLVLHNGTKSPSQERSRALQLSDRASILGPDDPLVLTARCAVHTMAGQLDHASALIARALACEPTFVWGWERSGWLKTFAGEPEAAIKHFEHAIRLDPHTLNANRLMGIGCAHFDAGRYDQAALWKRKGLQEQPGMEWINRTLCVSYARLGDRKAALQSLGALHRYSPNLTISKIVNALPFPKDFLDRVSEGLNDLGLPV